MIKIVTAVGVVLSVFTSMAYAENIEFSSEVTNSVKTKDKIEEYTQPIIIQISIKILK